MEHRVDSETLVSLGGDMGPGKLGMALPFHFCSQGAHYPSVVEFSPPSITALSSSPEEL